MNKTKIVCTIGPATQDVEVLKKLMKAGMSVARINFSHGNFEEQEKYINAVKQAREEVGLPVALLLDTQGPEIRTGKLEEAPVELKAEDEIVLTPEDIIGNKKRVGITYKDLYKDVKVGTIILIDDGKIEMEVEEIMGEDIRCKVMNGGFLGNRKSINVPGTHVSLPALKEKDIKDLINGCKADFDFVAASFIRNANDILEIRKVLDENGGENIKIISKIENQEGIDNFEEILQVGDGIMVARGDLGVEVPLEEVPILQKRIIKACNRVGKIVITATQMLDTMTENPRPTRAEVSDVANAIFDVSGAIMLSGESAMGKYPLECVETMSRISTAVESSINYWKRFRTREYDMFNLNYEFNLNYATCLTAMQLKSKAIFVYTQTGSTARIVSSFLPEAPIYAITSNKKTWRQLALSWNVTPILIEEQVDPDTLIEKGIRKAEALGYVEKNDLVVIAGGANILAGMGKEINKTIGGVIRV